MHVEAKVVAQPVWHEHARNAVVKKIVHGTTHLGEPIKTKIEERKKENQVKAA
jgi:hypothetical protein